MIKGQKQKKKKMLEPYLSIKFNGHLITGSLLPSYISQANRIAGVTINHAGHELPYTHVLTCPSSNGSTDHYLKWTLDAYMVQPLALELDYDKYFPYDDGKGNPIYDEDSGAILRDPIAGTPV